MQIKIALFLFAIAIKDTNPRNIQKTKRNQTNQSNQKQYAKRNKIRLEGIDTPEGTQPYGLEAKAFVVFTELVNYQ